jgi:hypothetical protein
MFFPFARRPRLGHSAIKQGRDRGARFLQPRFGLRGKQLYRGVPTRTLALGPHGRQRAHALAARELVGLGQQDVAGQFDFSAIAQHLPIEILERMARVHDQHDTAQGFALAQVSVDRLSPFFPHRLGDFRVTVAGQVDQAPHLVEGEDIQQLRAPGRFRGTRQARLVADRVQGAGFARVRAPGEGDFGARVRRQPARIGRARREARGAKRVARHR